VLGLLHHEALHDDVILVDHNLLSHRTKGLETPRAKGEVKGAQLSRKDLETKQSWKLLTAALTSHAEFTPGNHQ
jgi:hypothetical protein